MKNWFFVLAFVCFSAAAASAQINMDWTYHDDADDVDDRATEQVPGEDFTFLSPSGIVIPNDAPVVIYVLTANNFAGDLDEQVFVRWWNGETEHWVMAQWIKNIPLSPMGLNAQTFHGLPLAGEAMLDLWRVEIGADITRPGENYYVIQAKGWKDGDTKEAYLLRDAVPEKSQENALGQQWIGSPDYAGLDWSVRIGN